MKLMIMVLTTFLFSIEIYAQDHLCNYRFDRTDQSSVYPFTAAASCTPAILNSFSGNGNSWDEGLRLNMKTRTLISAGLFVPTILTGYLMSGSGGNPDDALLAVHKLSTVSNLVLLDATVLKKHNIASLSWQESLAAITMNVSFLATITTGGLQSIHRTMPGWVNTSHKITPWISVISSGILLYLLNN